MTLSSLQKNAFPLPTPLTPKLVALGLDSKTAAKVSRVYLSSALTLKETYETEYARACNAFIATSDNLGYSSKELRSKLLAVAVMRYMQALSKWMEDAIEKAEASLRRNKKPATQSKVKNAPTLSSKPSSMDDFKLPSKQASVSSPKPCPFDNISPPHAFPRAYPPPVRPGPIPFVTHIPMLEKKSEREQKTAPDYDLTMCIAAFARLSLGPPLPSRGSGKPSKTASKSRSRTHATSNLKPTSQLSPSHPRLVSPTLDTSVAVSHKPLPKNSPSNAPSTDTPRTQNIDIPRSNRRKVCSIPYRRPAIHPSTSPVSPSSSYFSRSIHCTPSLISDHGSEASSPSTPPDFPSMPIPIPTLAGKGSFPEAMSPLEHSPVRHSAWHSIDFGTDIYG